MKTVLLSAGIIVGLALTGMSAQADDAQARPDFATLDADGNGQITREELAAAGTARFDAVDADGNGTISLDELKAHVDGRAADRAERMFSRMDANEDGVLSPDEMSPRGGDRAARMFDRADANDDGTISEDEFETVKDRRGGRKGRGHGHGSRDRG